MRSQNEQYRRQVAKHKRETAQRGLAAVEWILVLPMTLLVIVGLLIFGTRYSDYLFMAQSAHELALAIARVPKMNRVQPGGDAFSLQFFGDACAVEDTTAAVCVNCLTDDDAGDDGETGCSIQFDGSTNYDCMSNVVQWYTCQLVRTKNMFFQSQMPVTVSYGGGGQPIPTVSVSITATPRQWLLPNWLPFFAPISVKSEVPYLVLP